MIFKLKTSKKTQEIFEEIGKSTALKPYTLVKHAIAWSLKKQGKITSFDSDTDGLELNRQTITGEYDDYHIDASIIENVLQVEKDHVYQKSRHTRGPIRQIIANMSGEEDSDQ